MIFCSILQYTVHWNKPPLAYLGLCASIQQESFHGAIYTTFGERIPDHPQRTSLGEQDLLEIKQKDITLFDPHQRRGSNSGPRQALRYRVPAARSPWPSCQVKEILKYNPETGSACCLREGEVLEGIVVRGFRSYVVYRCCAVLWKYLTLVGTDIGY